MARARIFRVFGIPAGVEILLSHQEVVDLNSGVVDNVGISWDADNPDPDELDAIAAILLLYASEMAFIDQEVGNRQGVRVILTLTALAGKPLILPRSAPDETFEIQPDPPVEGLTTVVNNGRLYVFILIRGFPFYSSCGADGVFRSWQSAALRREPAFQYHSLKAVSIGNRVILFGLYKGGGGDDKKIHSMECDPINDVWPESWTRLGESIGNPDYQWAQIGAAAIGDRVSLFGLHTDRTVLEARRDSGGWDSSWRNISADMEQDGWRFNKLFPVPTQAGLSLYCLYRGSPSEMGDPIYGKLNVPFDGAPSWERHWYQLSTRLRSPYRDYKWRFMAGAEANQDHLYLFGIARDHADVCYCVIRQGDDSVVDRKWLSIQTPPTRPKFHEISAVAFGPRIHLFGIHQSPDPNDNCEILQLVCDVTAGPFGRWGREWRAIYRPRPG